MGPVIKLMEFLWRVGYFGYLRSETSNLTQPGLTLYFTYFISHLVNFLGFIISSQYFPHRSPKLQPSMPREKRNLFQKKSSWEGFWIALSWGLCSFFRTISFPRKIKYLLWLTKTEWNLYPRIGLHEGSWCLWKDFNPRERHVMAQKHGLRTICQDKGRHMIMKVVLFLSIT